MKQREGRGSGEVLGCGAVVGVVGAGAGEPERVWSGRGGRWSGPGVVRAGVAGEGRGIWRGRGKGDRAKGYIQLEGGMLVMAHHLGVRQKTFIAMVHHPLVRH